MTARGDTGQVIDVLAKKEKAQESPSRMMPPAMAAVELREIIKSWGYSEKFARERAADFHAQAETRREPAEWFKFWTRTKANGHNVQMR